METLDGSEWDVLLAGTGLQQSLLALALSRSSKKVLHVDRNDFYGGPEAAFSLQEAESWVDTLRTDPQGSAHFRDVELRRRAGEAEEAGRLGFSRAYSLTLSPQVVYTLSTLLPVLVSSKVYRQLEFMAVGSWWLYSEAPDTAEEGSSSSESPSLGKLQRIPSGREDVFADNSLDLKAKRSLMKFLRFVVDYDDQTETWEPHAEDPLVDFLSREFKVPSSLHNAILALTLSSNPTPDTKTGFALPRIARHLRSIGVFGPGFGSVLAKYGGLSEIAQVGCRAGAVGGAAYVLGRGVEAIHSSGPDAETPHLSVQLKEGDSVKVKWIVGGDDDLPEDCSPQTISVPSAQVMPDALSRSIAIVSSPLASLFPRTAEGSPPPAGAVVYYASGTLQLSGNNTTLPPVYVFVHSSESGECPSNQCVLYASTALRGPGGAQLLDLAVEKILESINEQPAPEVLWSTHYQQTSTSPQPSSENSSTEQVQGQDSESHILKFPSLSNDLAFDDTILTRVREAWVKIMGPDATGFMEFEDREAMGEEYDDE